MSRELSVGIADCLGKSDLPFLRCEGYFTELTAMVQLQLDKDHSFDAYFAAESSASSLQDVTKLEFTQIHWTDDRLQRMSNLPVRVPASVELVLDGKMRKRRRRNFHSEEFLLSWSGLELILGGLLGHPAHHPKIDVAWFVKEGYQTSRSFYPTTYTASSLRSFRKWEWSRSCSCCWCVLE